jgi:hypothetical protein
LPKSVVRRIILELIASLGYHLAARPRDNNDCAIREDLVREAVTNCMALAEVLVDPPADE